MAAQRGIDMLLEVDSTGGGVYQTVAGIRSTSYKLDGEIVDITSMDDTTRYRQLLANAGVKSMSITGSGVFKDAAADATAKQYWVDGTIRNWRVTIPSFNTVTGMMQIQSIEYAGEHNGEVTHSLTLESAGNLTFAAI